MSVNNRVTTSTIREKKAAKEPITMLTAYDFSMARILDQAGIDMFLVGDSLANVMLGYESTLPVTMEEMLHHVKAVCRGTTRAMVIADMPFMSYQISTEIALQNAGRFIKEAGAQAVKLEGGQEVQETVKAIVRAGIPVVGHLGLTPQSVHALGGYKVQGKDEQTAQKIMDDARVLQESGVFALVLECVPALLAKKVTESINIPTIGIGAGADCDGQVLVTHDMLGLYSGFTPKFVKKFANLHQEILSAVTAYKEEVSKKSFPAKEHGFQIADSIIEKLY